VKIIVRILLELLLVIIAGIILFILTIKGNKDLYRIQRELEISKDTTKNLTYMFNKLIDKK
jgi:hypothetical protein